jgi:aldose 1-epimerase
MTDFYQLTNSKGDKVIISRYGARLCRWRIKLADHYRDIVLGYDNITQYQQDPFYLGAIIGPYANRLANAQCQINEQTFHFNANEGKHLLHGGKNALEAQYWQVDYADNQQISFSITLADNFNGFPGPITFKVKYCLEASGDLLLSIQATSEKMTIIAPTAHPYFNLNGIEQDISGQQLTIHSDYITAIDHELIPTGELLAVENSRFDFRQPRTLTQSNNDKFDHNFVVKPNIEQFQAELISADKQLTLQLYSDFPGLQFYTADYLTSPFYPRQALCLEPQYYPNSPNIPEFPFKITAPNETLEHQMIYRLFRAES